MTIEGMAEYLQQHDNYIILSHDGPDADGLGAAYCLTLALRKLGKKAEAAISEALSPKFKFIDQVNLFRQLAEGFTAPEGAIPIVVDTHDIAYLGSRSSEVVSKAAFALFIDHHELKGRIEDLQLIDSTASSSCELVHQIVSLWGVQISLDEAEALYAGIIYDTGSFSYPKTSARTFSCALDLVRRGVVPYKLYTSLYESASKGALLLQKAVISTLELVQGGRVAIQKMEKNELLASGASYEDAEELVNIPLQDKRVEVSLLFKESPEGKLRCSLRSKGEVNVARIAQAFGGGGHKTAAGFTCEAPLAHSLEAVLEILAQAMGPL